MWVERRSSGQTWFARDELGGAGYRLSSSYSSKDRLFRFRLEVEIGRDMFADILEASASTSEPTGGRQIEVARDCRPDLGGEVEEGKGYLGRFLLDPTHLELVDREACGIGSSITFGLIYHIGW
jgi:hypothetical protein